MRRIRLYLQRLTTEGQPDGVYGQLVGDGALTHTLESAQHLIPPGTYQVRLTPSGRVQRGSLWSPEPPFLPELVEVPGRTAIRIHAGNSPADTIGCILLGESLTPSGLLARSRAAMRRIWWVFRNGNEVTLEISDVKGDGSAKLA